MYPLHASYFEVIDAEGYTHFVHANFISRVSLLGGAADPDVEIWVQFGGVIHLVGEQAQLFLNTWRDVEHILQPRERQYHD